MLNKIDECYELLRLRESRMHAVRFFYVGEDVEMQMLEESRRYLYRASSHATLQPCYGITLYGVRVIRLPELPPGFILASSTELH